MSDLQSPKSTMSEPTSPQSNGSSTMTVELNTDYTNAHRFPMWMALCVFSVICLAALESRKGIFNADTSGEKWVTAVAIMSMLLAFIAIIFYLVMRGVFVGQLPEVILTALLLAFWSAALPTLMNPGKDIAVSKPENDEVGSVVTNANLYFFAWLSFATCVYMSGSLAQEATGVDVTKTPAKTARWYGLTASSLVVLGSAVRTFTTSDCDLDKEDNAEITYCRRSKFAVAMGVVGFFFAAAMTLMTRKGLTLKAETLLTTLQLVLWCFGVGFITFGTSPGSTIGNLFFGCWISFILTVFLFAQCFREYVAGREGAIAAQQNGDSGDLEKEQSQQDAYDDAI